MWWRAKPVNFMPIRSSSKVFAEQLAYANAAVAENPFDAGSLEYRAQIRALRCDDKMLAVADCRAALQLRLKQCHRKTGDVLAQGRVWFRRGLAVEDGSFYCHFMPQAIAHFDVAINRAPRNAIIYKERGIAWAHLRERARAEADFARWRALKGETRQCWRVQAEAFLSFHALDHEAAVFAYRRMLELSAGEFTSARCLSRARSKRTPRLLALAYLELALEIAPHEIEPFIERVNWWAQRSDKEKADIDWQRALQIWPDEPAIYQARASLTDHSGEFKGTAADYAHALRLRIAASPSLGTAKSLRNRADELKKGTDGHGTQLFAIYSVAIERDPQCAMLHVLRAALVREMFDFADDDLFDDDPVHEILRDALEDEMRALQLNGKLKTPRTALVKHFARRLAGVTAHEQLEGLLQMRARLRESGVGEKLATSISAEVEARLRET